MRFTSPTGTENTLTMEAGTSGRPKRSYLMLSSSPVSGLNEKSRTCDVESSTHLAKDR